MIPPFKWIGTFMDTCEEWHAFVEGFNEGFCLGPGRFEPDEERLKHIQSEHHYYSFGRGLGRAILFALIVGAIRWAIARRHHA